MGVGVKPQTDFLKSSGFEFEKDGSLKVDEYLRVIGKENDNIYAIGDIATYKQTIRPGSRRVEHWNVAQNHGRAVGKTVAALSQGKKDALQPFVKVPIFWSAREPYATYDATISVLMYGAQRVSSSAMSALITRTTMLLSTGTPTNWSSSRITPRALKSSL